MTSLSWLDNRHFLSIDVDGHRLRTWNIHRKETINESISSQGALQSLHVHPTHNDTQHRQEFLIAGCSSNERSLSLFEYTQPTAGDPLDASHVTIC
jgi:hypothetical protein